MKTENRSQPIRQDPGHINARRAGDVWVVKENEEIWRPPVAVSEEIIRGLPDFRTGYCYTGDDGHLSLFVSVETSEGTWPDASSTKQTRYLPGVINALGDQISEPGHSLASGLSWSCLRNEVGIGLVDGSYDLFDPIRSYWTTDEWTDTDYIPVPEFRVVVYRNSGGLELTGVTLAPDLRLRSLQYASDAEVELIADVPADDVDPKWLEQRVTGPHGSAQWIEPPNSLSAMNAAAAAAE